MRTRTDLFLLVVTLSLVGIGLVMTYSASGFLAAKSQKFNYDNLYFLKREVFRLLVGVVVFIFVWRFNYRIRKNWISPLFLFSIFLLLSVLLMGKSVRGAKSWLEMYSFCLFQPSELIRLTGLVFFAHLIARKGEEIKNFRQGFLPLLFWLGVVICLIICQPDWGTALAISITLYLLMFLGGVSLKKWLVVAMVGLGLLTFVSFRVPHLKNRWQGYWISLQEARPKPKIIENYPPGSPLFNTVSQTYQSLIGIGSGGWCGVGLGVSKQKYLFIPEPHTDFIFSIIAEETGLLGAGGILLLYLFFAWRGFSIAKQTGEPFERLVAYGVTINIFTYALINIGVAIGLFPITGLPLPFISYGGSSLVINLCLAGFLLNISRHVKERPRLKLVQLQKTYASDSQCWWDGRTSLSRNSLG
ncbi:MAG: FtsW/RodA/SpoVE family cell cycle protein [Candidatus Edwardsbacteria bacterium]